MRYIIEIGIIPKGIGNSSYLSFSQSHYENYALITTLFVIYFSLQKLLLRRFMFQPYRHWIILHLGVLVIFFFIEVVANTLHMAQHNITIKTIFIQFPQGNAGRIDIAPELSFLTLLMLLSIGALQTALFRPHIHKAWIILAVYSAIPVFILLASLINSIANIRYFFLYAPYYLLLGIVLTSGSAIIALSTGLLARTTEKPKRIEELPRMYSVE